MSLPPQILRIKRKRDDEPVDALYIETGSKRRVLNQKFVFRRVTVKGTNVRTNSSAPSSARNPVTTPSPVNSTTRNGIPSVIATLPGEENAFLERRRHGKQSPEPLQEHIPHDITRDGSSDGSDRIPGIARIQSRRFHLSNATSLVKSGAGKSKRDADAEVNPIAVFVEEEQQQHEGVGGGQLDGNSLSTTDMTGVDGRETPSQRKRPGATAAVSKTATPLQRPWPGDETGSQMHEALQKFAMEELVPATPSRDPASSDIKQISKDLDGDIEMEEDSDYIYETYIRHPHPQSVSSVKASSSMDTYPSAPSGSDPIIGYLVIPESSKAYFYSHDYDSGDEEEDDWDSEQDDENAENYYGADYPEEEVESDDEKGTDVYAKYRRAGGGGSDEEEWGNESDEEAWSEVEGDTQEGRHKPPWEKRKKAWGWDEGTGNGLFRGPSTAVKHGSGDTESEEEGVE